MVVDQPSQPEPAPARPRPADPFSYGPPIKLPVGPMALASGAAAIAMGGLGASLAAAIRPSGIWSVVPGVGAVLGALGISILILRPWHARPMGRWLTAWMASRMASLVAVLALGGLLYFSSPFQPDIPVMGLTLGASYFAATVAEAWTLSRRLKESPTLFDR